MDGCAEDALLGDEEHWLAASGITDLSRQVEQVAGLAAALERAADLEPIQPALVPSAILLEGLGLPQPLVEQGVVGRRQDEDHGLVRREPVRGGSPADRVKDGDGDCEGHIRLSQPDFIREEHHFSPVSCPKVSTQDRVGRLGLPSAVGLDLGVELRFVAEHLS